MSWVSWTMKTEKRTWEDARKEVGLLARPLLGRRTHGADVGHDEVVDGEAEQRPERSGEDEEEEGGEEGGRPVGDVVPRVGGVEAEEGEDGGGEGGLAQGEADDGQAVGGAGDADEEALAGGPRGKDGQGPARLAAPLGLELQRQGARERARHRGHEQHLARGRAHETLHGAGVGGARDAGDGRRGQLERQQAEHAPHEDRARPPVRQRAQRHVLDGAPRLAARGAVVALRRAALARHHRRHARGARSVVQGAAPGHRPPSSARAHQAKAQRKRPHPAELLSPRRPLAEERATERTGAATRRHVNMSTRANASSASHAVKVRFKIIVHIQSTS